MSENSFLGAQRIFLFLDRKTKDPTGDATVTFQSPESAKKAIDQFDQTDFNGHGMISVKQASPDQKNPFAEMLVSTFDDRQQRSTDESRISDQDCRSVEP